MNISLGSMPRMTSATPLEFIVIWSYLHWREDRKGAAEQAVAAAERHAGPLGTLPMPRRRGLRPRLLAAVIRSTASLAFTAERQAVGQTGDASRELEHGLARF